MSMFNYVIATAELLADYWSGIIGQIAENAIRNAAIYDRHGAAC